MGKLAALWMAAASDDPARPRGHGHAKRRPRIRTGMIAMAAMIAIGMIAMVAMVAVISMRAVLPMRGVLPVPAMVRMVPRADAAFVDLDAAVGDRARAGRIMAARLGRPVIGSLVRRAGTDQPQSGDGGKQEQLLHDQPPSTRRR